MKRLFGLLLAIMVFLLSALSVSALKFNVEEIEYGSKPLIPCLSPSEYDCYLTKMNGEDYFIRYRSAHGPIKYDEKEFDFFSNAENGNYLIYMWTGEYYYAKNTTYDILHYRRTLLEMNHVALFDRDFNIVKEHCLPYYPIDIDYKDGAYYAYCDISDSWSQNMLYLKSYDFENWEETDEPALQKNGNLWRRNNNQVSFDGETFYDIAYEKINYPNEKDMGIIADDDYTPQKETPKNIFSGYMIRTDFYGNTYLSYDNVYNLIIEGGSNASDLEYIYEHDGNLVFDTYSRRYSIPIQDIRDEMDKYYNPVYVKLNDKILGFTQPPTIESDRTLVPMRFLFEQTGNSVNWDDATQSVIVQGKSDTVTFSVDSTTAKVNGASKTMDVPARLINDKTMVPLRFLSEELGYTVEWDEENNMVKIITE